MSRVTSKLQVTIPKAIAEAHEITPGSDIVFESAGDTIRVRLVTAAHESGTPDVDLRLKMFDEATLRHLESRQRILNTLGEAGGDRRWRREDLYDRGLAR